jgi:hypothetical protein
MGCEECRRFGRYYLPGRFIDLLYSLHLIKGAGIEYHNYPGSDCQGQQFIFWGVRFER